jgi:hypothetical protein
MRPNAYPPRDPPTNIPDTNAMNDANIDVNQMAIGGLTEVSTSPDTNSQEQTLETLDELFGYLEGPKLGQEAGRGHPIEVESTEK